MDLLMTVYMHDGWSRVLPLYAQAPVHAIAALDGATREELDVEIARHFETTAGLASTAWEPLRQWTDEELQELDSEFGVPEGEPRTAADVMKWEAEARDKHLVAMERYARHLGVPKVQTIGDLLDFMSLPAYFSSTTASTRSTRTHRYQQKRCRCRPAMQRPRMPTGGGGCTRGSPPESSACSTHEAWRAPTS